VVASVDGSLITEATLDHWVAVQAATDYEPVPKGPIPAGAVPDPPGFRACVAYLRRGGATHEAPAVPRTNEELVTECETNYKTLRNHVLGILISFKWWEAEAKALGIRADEQKVATEFTRFRKEQYGSVVKYQNYLRRTKQTLADSYLRMRIDLLTLGLSKHFLSQGKAAFVRYMQQFPKEWAAKTVCQPQDLVPNCKKYKGSTAPEARI
jgi:hypothetical protein